MKECEQLNACKVIIDERLENLDKQIDLLKQREALMADQSDALRKNPNNINVVDSFNKEKQWPFHAYEFCFLIKTLPQFKFLLPTVLIRLEVDGVVHGPYRALLDTGAQPTIISHALFKQLRCTTSQSMKRVLGVGTVPLMIRKKAQVIIRPWFESRECVHDQAWILPHESDWRPILPSQELAVRDTDNEFRNDLADPDYFRPKEVHIILGVGFVAKILDRKIGHVCEGSAIVNTQFGKVIMGEHLDYTGENVETIATIMDDSMDKRLSEMIEKLWKQDEIEGSDRESKWTKEETMVERHFETSHYRDRDGRFVVKIPFKPGIDSIGSSRAIAWRRFIGLERKFERHPDMKEFYIKEMRDLIAKGHLKAVNRAPKPNQICFYIPHHFVFTKPRVVYDGSCATNTGVSLNEVQMLGPKLQLDLHLTLMRFRRHKVGLCADIQKMFNQVKLNEEQWDCQRIFWREGPDEEIKEYWITVVTFGLASSPYLAVRCVKQAAREAKKEYPEAAKVLEDDFYMDDMITGDDTVEKAIGIARGVDCVLTGAGFHLRKYKSNKKAVLDAMNETNKGTEESMVFAIDEQTSILGIKWLFARDQYTFVIKTPKFDGPVTKRKVVSRTAQLYDPNGYVSPVTVIGKAIIQKLWSAKVEWDEPITGELEKAWLRFWDEIQELEKFRIDRWIGTTPQAKTKLIGFSDSSTMAYGAVIYARTVYPNGLVRCRMITSKTRVAPLKTMTIPRLELAAAELLAKLVIEVKNSMEFPDMQYILFTDSSATLHWIRKEPAQLKRYVENRVSSIQTLTDLKKWRYVNTKENPADLLSRGVRPSLLVDNKLWLFGPEWLSLPESDWPTEQFPMKLTPEATIEFRIHTITEVKNNLTLKRINKATRHMERLGILEYVDDIEKAQRIIAYVIRYVNARLSGFKPPSIATRSANIVPHPPTPKEKGHAMEYFVKKSQQLYFNAERTALKGGKSISDKSKLIALNPFLDKRGIMRVGGRIGKALVDYDRKHPMIIPKGTRLAWLLMRQAHRLCLHGVIQVQMQFLRRKYWIPQLRDELKKFSRECIECVRNKPITQEQIMADLPADRIRPGRPFETSGVDYAGPFQVKYVDKEGQPILIVKAWMVVFVCLKTRAVHLDIVNDLKSSSFIACYEEFVSRRGRCYKMYSDNGTSFIGAEKAIARAYKEWQTDDTVSSIAKRGTEWHFMTPAAPHQGGIYEAAVKSMKFHLKRVIGSRIMEYRQIRTLLCKVEAVLNSRPLSALTDDPNDLHALTPGHFLIGEELVTPPSFDHVNEDDLQGRKLWLERDKMFKDFWARWHNEVLTSMIERKKWRREREDIKVGQLVIIKDENLPPTHWRMARVAEVSPSSDKRVRNVLVKTEKGTFKRPIQKLCLLPIDVPEPANHGPAEAMDATETSAETSK